MKKTVARMLFGVVLFFAGSVGWAAVEVAPAFSLPGIDGKTVNLKDVIGKKIVVLNFWSSWCPSCKEEVPELKVFQASPGANKAVFIGINNGEDERKAQRFVDKTDYPFKVLVDQDMKVAKQYDVQRIPLTVIIGKDGKILYRGSRPPKNYTF